MSRKRYVEPIGPRELSETVLPCPRCHYEGRVITQRVQFRNRGKHLEARCAQCDKYIKYLPSKIPPHFFRMPIGKYKGKTLLEILQEDREYLVWCYENFNKGSLRDRILKVLEDNGRPEDRSPNVVDLPTWEDSAEPAFSRTKQDASLKKIQDLEWRIRELEEENAKLSRKSSYRGYLG